MHSHQKKEMISQTNRWANLSTQAGGQLLNEGSLPSPSDEKKRCLEEGMALINQESFLQIEDERGWKSVERTGIPEGRRRVLRGGGWSPWQLPQGKTPQRNSIQKRHETPRIDHAETKCAHVAALGGSVVVTNVGSAPPHRPIPGRAWALRTTRTPRGRRPAAPLGKSRMRGRRAKSFKTFILLEKKWAATRGTRPLFSLS